MRSIPALVVVVVSWDLARPVEAIGAIQYAVRFIGSSTNQRSRIQAQRDLQMGYREQRVRMAGTMASWAVSSSLRVKNHLFRRPARLMVIHRILALSFDTSRLLLFLSGVFAKMDVFAH